MNPSEISPDCELDSDGFRKMTFFVNGKVLFPPKKTVPSEPDRDEAEEVLNLNDIDELILDDPVEEEVLELEPISLEDEIKVLAISPEKTIPKELWERCKAHSLTKTFLLSHTLTDILRLASFDEYAERVVAKEFGYSPVPLIAPYKLYACQEKTILWMRERERQQISGVSGGILCLSMGLGKSLCSSFNALMAPKVKGGFPTLVVCSLTMIGEWRSQCFEKFFGKSIKVLYLHKKYIGPHMDTITRDEILTYDFVITTYDVCRGICKTKSYAEDVCIRGDEHSLYKDKIVAIVTRTRGQANKPHLKGADTIYGTPWARVICDESQTFVNPTTATYKAIMAIYGEYKWCLSGTPIRNYETDIWAQMRWLGYDNPTVQAAHEWKKRGGPLLFQKDGLDKCIFRMDYIEAGIILPKKKETSDGLLLTLQGREKDCYDAMLNVARVVHDQVMKNLCSYSCVLKMFTRLRQVCIAPYLITNNAKRKKIKKKTLDENAMRMLDAAVGSLGKWVHDKYGEAGIQSAKMKAIINIIKSIPPTEKILVFSMFTSCLDLIELALETYLPKVKYVMLDGAVTGEDRDNVINKFRNNPKVRVMLATLKCGSEGLTLIEATHCIVVETYWNDAVPRQAKARCWRIGQTREVTIYNIVIDNSIERKMLEICEGKDEMAASYLEGSTKTIKAALKMDKLTLHRLLNDGN